MTSSKLRAGHASVIRFFAVLLPCLLLSSTLTGCLVLGGSSRGGFFIFPGSVGLILLILVVGLILRRR